MAIKDRQKYDEDLFKESTMTFGEHLEELRTALFKALMGLMAGFLFGLLVGKPVVLALQQPLKSALEEYYEEESFNKWLEEQEKQGIVVDDEVIESKQIPGIDQQEHLISETIYVSPQELAKQLGRNYPQQFADAMVPKNQAEHLLSRDGPQTVLPADLSKPKALAEKLTEAASGGASPAKRVWERLSGTAQAEVKKMLLFEGMQAEVAHDNRQAVADGLTAVLDRPDLYDAEVFAEAKLRPEARELLERKNLSPEKQRRLNRLLLEAALPEVLAESYPNLLPLTFWRTIFDDPRTKIQSLSAGEVFGFWIKAALVVGALLASPYIFIQLWNFVAAGLYPHERKYVHIYLPFSIGLFILGAGMAFIFVFGPVLRFLFGFNHWLGIDPDPRISEWMGFVLLLPVGFGTSFQLPLIMLFLERIGVFTVQMYIEKWRIAVLAIFVIAMILTPADPVSMMLMAGPLTLLYFGAIGLCKWMPRGHNPFDDEDLATT